MVTVGVTRFFASISAYFYLDHLDFFGGRSDFLLYPPRNAKYTENCAKKEENSCDVDNQHRQPGYFPHIDRNDDTVWQKLGIMVESPSGQHATQYRTWPCNLSFS